MEVVIVLPTLMVIYGYSHMFFYIYIHIHYFWMEHCLRFCYSTDWFPWLSQLGVGKGAERSAELGVVDKKSQVSLGHQYHPRSAKKMLSFSWWGLNFNQQKLEKNGWFFFDGWNIEFLLVSRYSKREKDWRISLWLCQYIARWKPRPLK